MRLHDGVTPQGHNPGIKGLIRLWEVPDDGSSRILRAVHKNQIAYSWGHIACQTLGLGKREYRIGAMYFEFDNNGLPVGAPSFDRSEGIEYYENLQFVGGRDFLRIPLRQAPTIGIEPGFEEFFTDGVDGNLLTVAAQTMGTEGIHGTPFSNGDNSGVIGCAMVATPDLADRTKDIVLARAYLDAADQLIKPAAGQLLASWDLSFL